MTDPNLQHRKEMAQYYDGLRKEWKSKLNPADYPGSLSLIFELDTLVCVVTEDGNTFIGELSSYDTFGSIVLAKARWRFFAPERVQDIQLGIAFVRAERIVLIGSIDKQKETELFGTNKMLPPEEPAE